MRWDPRFEGIGQAIKYTNITASNYVIEENEVVYIPRDVTVAFKRLEVKGKLVIDGKVVVNQILIEGEVEVNGELVVA